MLFSVTAFALLCLASCGHAMEPDSISVHEIGSCIREEFASDVASSICAVTMAQTNLADRLICARLARCISIHHFKPRLHLPPCNLTTASTVDDERECATEICSSEIGRFIYFQCTTHVEIACQRVSNTLLARGQETITGTLKSIDATIITLSSNVDQINGSIDAFRLATDRSFDAQQRLIQDQTKEISELTNTVHTQTARIGSLSRQVAKAELALSKQMLDVKTELKADIYYASMLTYLLGCSGIGAGLLAFVKACIADRQAKAREMTSNDLDKAVSVLATSSDTLLYKVLRSGTNYGGRAALRN